MADSFSVKVSIEIFPERLLTPTGIVSVKIKETAERVKEVARDLIGTRYSGHHPEDGKLLKDCGRVERGSAGGADWRVVFTKPSKGKNKVDIALLHHNGTEKKMYLIPRGGQPNKTFRGKRRVFLYRGTPEVFGPRYTPVTHPGSTGNPYLLNAAKQLGLKPSGALKRGNAVATPIFRGFV